MKAETGHLRNRGWLSLPTRDKEKISKASQKAANERRAANIPAPVLDWKRGNGK